MGIVTENLKAALALFRDGEGWTQGMYARDAEGDEVGSCHERACAWCSVGALLRVCAGTGTFDATKTVLWDSVGDSVICWNDNMCVTFEDAKAGFEIAIAHAEERGL